MPAPTQRRQCRQYWVVSQHQARGSVHTVSNNRRGSRSHGGYSTAHRAQQIDSTCLVERGNVLRHTRHVKQALTHRRRTAGIQGQAIACACWWAESRVGKPNVVVVVSHPHTQAADSRPEPSCGEVWATPRLLALGATVLLFRGTFCVLHLLLTGGYCHLLCQERDGLPPVIGWIGCAGASGDGRTLPLRVCPGIPPPRNRVRCASCVNRELRETMSAWSPPPRSHHGSK